MALVPCLHFASLAQYWAPANLPLVVDGQLWQFYSDETEGIFCVCGRTKVPENAPSPWRNGLVCNVNELWDTLGIFNGDVSSAVQWADTLFVCGGFTGIDSLALGRILGRVEGAWLSLGEPENAGATKLKRINDELYRLGSGPTLHGLPATGISKRMGGQWVPLGNLPPPDVPGGGNWIFDIIEYNGQLVITGNINTEVGDDVFVLQGDDWVPLGGGLVGWNSYGKRLAVYQGDLYVAGGIFMSQGDAGQNIMRWDGQQWHPLGTGLQTQLGSFGQTGGVEDMMVHHGELWVSGGFRYASGVYARGVVRWDGSQWCSVGGEPSSTVFCFGFFQDTLYINSPGPIDGQDMDYVAKFVAPEYEDNCGLWAGVGDAGFTSLPLVIWPNPAGSLLRCATPVRGSVRARIWDGVGRLVRDASLRVIEDQLEIDVTDLEPGLFLQEIEEQYGLKRATRFVKD
ncbi:MAG: hypothetical protein IPM12_00115 [Flavobacteriales bacterium]|nr:hypothetical protein [Flavobacteriales bacterium]